MKFSMHNIQELMRHLKCISREKFNAIDFNCDSDHMWAKLKNRTPSEFIMDLDSGNLEALSNYFNKYLIRQEF